MIGKIVVGKAFIATSLVLCFLFFTGCGGRLSRANYERIKTGMTLKEVEAILGKGNEQSSSQIDIPDQSFSIPGLGSTTVAGMSSSMQVVTWGDGLKTIAITFSNGKVASKLQTGL